MLKIEKELISTIKSKKQELFDWLEEGKGYFEEEEYSKEDQLIDIANEVEGDIDYIIDELNVIRDKLVRYYLRADWINNNRELLSFIEEMEEEYRSFEVPREGFYKGEEVLLMGVENGPYYFQYEITNKATNKVIANVEYEKGQFEEVKTF